jgi:uncharacterized protein YndB with AHSA1/START domain
MTTHRVDAKRRVNAPVEAVWEAWADPERLAGWFVDGADARLDAAERVRWTWTEFALTVEYDVVAVDPPHGFQLRMAMPDGSERSVRVELEGKGRGETDVRVAQWGFADAEEARAARSGWRISLELLARFLEQYPERRRRSFLLMAPVPASPATLRHLYRTGPGLASWLGAAEDVPAEDGVFRVRLDAGGSISGRVLCLTEMEAALTWDEIDGILEMKAFPGPDGLVVALRVSSWAEEGDIEEQRAILAGAFDRLLGRARESAPDSPRTPGSPDGTLPDPAGPPG